jgi:hypothetical protein
MKIFIKKKSPSAKGQRADDFLAPQQNDFRTFCMSDETENVHE